MSKKILQIKKGEYLHAVLKSGGAIDTTYHTQFALDISSWDLDTLGHIVSNLKKVGYTDAQILTIEDEQEQGENDGEQV